MFKTRLLSGILLVLIALFTVISGGSILFAVLFIISMIGLSELYKVFDIRNKAPGICGYLFAAAYYAPDLFEAGSAGRDRLVYAFVHGIFNLYDGSACILLSQIQDRADTGSIFRCILCGCDAVLYLSDPHPCRAGYLPYGWYSSAPGDAIPVPIAWAC